MQLARALKKPPRVVAESLVAALMALPGAAALIEQADIEAADTGDYEQWRQQYITSVFPLISD